MPQDSHLFLSQKEISGKHRTWDLPSGFVSHTAYFLYVLFLKDFWSKEIGVVCKSTWQNVCTYSYVSEYVSKFV